MRYEKDGLEFPSVTEIISDCTDKSQGLLPWATGEVCRWIRDNCEIDTKKMTLSDGWVPTYNDPDNIGCEPPVEPMNPYEVYPEDLDKARYAYKDVSQTALDVGSEVHGYIEEYLCGVLYGRQKPDRDISNIENEQARNAMGAFLQWEKKHDLKPIALEQKVYGNGWAGALDFIGYFDDKLYVIDWKSSKAFYPEMRYQVAAYRWAMDSKLVDEYAAEYGYGNAAIMNYTNDIVGCGVLRLDKTTGEPFFKDTSSTYLDDLDVFNAMVDLYFLRHPIIRKKAGR